MKVRLQLSAVVLLCVMLLLAALTSLCWHFAEVQKQQLAYERNHFLLQSLRKTAQDYLAIGMTPDQMPAMQNVIDAEKAGFPQVVAIDLFSPAGHITYSTDAGARDAQVPQDWIHQLEQNVAWETQDPTQDQLGMRFDNNLGRPAGGIVVTLQPLNSPWTLAQWQHTGLQALRWLGMATSVCLVASLLGLYLFQRALRPYRSIRLLLEQQHAIDDDNPIVRELQPLTTQAAKSLQQQHEKAQQALQRLQEIDRAD